jgi:hypothetical protein
MVFDYTSYTFEFLFYFWISSLSSFSSFSSFDLLVFLFSPANIACSSIPLQVPAFALIRPALVASPSNTPIPPEFDYLSVSVWSLHLSWGKKKKTNTEKEHNPLTRDQYRINYPLEEHYMHPQVFNSPLDSTELQQARFIRSLTYENGWSK